MGRLINPQGKKATNLFIILSGIFLTNAIIAEIIGVKIFSAEPLVGADPEGIELWQGFYLKFTLTAGAVIWPIVFITTDIINEYFGKPGVRKISWITAFFIAYSFLIIWFATYLPPAQFWLDVNAPEGESSQYNIDYWYNIIFTQGLGIIVGSITAFLLGQLLDIYVFDMIRSATGKKYLWLRATGSTLVSQLVDSFVVLYIAFNLFSRTNPWSMDMILSVGTNNYLFKIFMAILLSPLLYIAHFLIDRYLGEEATRSKKEILNTTPSNPVDAEG
ncbi:queuosine precursor transporter [Cytophagaceae bacterium ABcell3]|nr:queuosine precursor transporter [Cytophagaceae bacterium ABcell3]